MSLYDKTLQDLIDKKNRRESGLFNGVDSPFPRHSEYFSGFEKGQYIGLLGTTGDGKSKLSRFFMYSMIDFAIKNHYPIKIIYFALEDTDIPVYKKIMSHYLFIRQNIDISQDYFNSKHTPLSSHYIDCIRKDEKFWRLFDKIVWIVNSVSSPNAMQKTVDSVYKKYGESHHIFVILDNQSNITKDSEVDDSEWAAIKRMSRDIVRLDFCSKGITTLAVLQTDFATEGNAFRNAGKGSLLNIEPNLSSIGDAKIVCRSMHTVFGLFSPWRYELPHYPSSDAYDCGILRNRIKSILHLKSNEGEMSPRLCLKFDGKHEIFEELPQVQDKDALQKIYTDIIEQEKAKRAHLQKLF